MEKIYLDYAATTPTDPEAVKAMEPYFFERFGNASSPHSFGREAKKAVDEARHVLADFIGAQDEEVIFTSGGTESNNTVIFGAAHALRSKGSHIITSKIEHHSVLEAVHRLEKEGFKITFVNADKTGLVKPEDIKKAITDKTILISVMHANNEIGTIQPIAQIGALAKEKNIYFHTDAVQTTGRIPVNVHELHADFLSLSAHKFYGPKGIGALYIKNGTKLSPFLVGGGQERGRRSSTHNLPGIAGLKKAIELCRLHQEEEISRQKTLRDKIISEITRKIEGVQLNGHPAERLPNNVHLSFLNVDGEALLMSLDMAGIAASMGSACTSGALEPSHVLRAIGLSDELALGSLRITLGRWTTPSDVNYLLDNLPSIIERIRLISTNKT